MAQLLEKAASDSDATTSDSFPRKQWTLTECRRIVDDGILDGAKYELIEGDVVPKMGQGRFHIIVITRLLALLAAIFGADFLQIQAPVGIGEIQETSDPEPDVAVLKQTIRSYAEQPPDPARDVRLVIEASDSTLQGDLTVKTRLYARAGIPEYWVVDIRGRKLIVFRDPDGDNYRNRVTYGEAETVVPLAAPNVSLLIADMLP